MKFLILLITITAFVSSCGVKNISYDRSKIIKKYSSKYEIQVDSDIINLEYLYLNKENIKNILVDRKNEIVRINQIRPVKFYKISELDLDSLNVDKESNIVMTIINGIPLDEKMTEETLIDKNAIEKIIVVLGNDLAKANLIGREGRDLLLITTK